MPKFSVQLLYIAICLSAGAPGAFAGRGSIPLSWSTIPERGDIVGYRLYLSQNGNLFDPANRVNIPGAMTSIGSVHLPDCEIWYIAGRSYTATQESLNSNIAIGLNTPIIDAIVPRFIRQGSTSTFTIRGTNFYVPDARFSSDPRRTRVEFSVPFISTQTMPISNCGSLQFTAAVAPNAPLGRAALSVLNPDLSPGVSNWARGSYADAVYILPAGSNHIAPRVMSVTPAAKQTLVLTSVRPTVKFSKSMDPSLITSTNVQLLEENGSNSPIVVEQAMNSPRILDTQLKQFQIIPKNPLRFGAKYRVFIRDAISDVDRNALEVEYLQPFPFTIEPESDSTPLATPSLRRVKRTATGLQTCSSDEALQEGVCENDIRWELIPGAQFYVVERCQNSICEVIGDTSIRRVSNIRRVSAEEKIWPVALDGNFVPQGAIAVEVSNPKFPKRGTLHTYRVKAGKTYSESHVVYSEYSNPVTYVGSKFICIGHDRTLLPCYPGAPLKPVDE